MKRDTKKNTLNDIEGKKYGVTYIEKITQRVIHRKINKES